LIGDSLRCPSENSQCTSGGRGHFCTCKSGYTENDCSKQDFDCFNEVCAGVNETCKHGYCVCKENYSKININGGIACHPTLPASGYCSNCKMHEVCANVDGIIGCHCPVEYYGAYDCSKPKCISDTSCKEDNSYCVNSTHSHVPFYCQCKPGYRGAKCDVKVICDAKNCGANQHCDNEGMCRCIPGRSGINCENQIPVKCSHFKAITTKNIWELSSAIAEVARCDVSNLLINPYSSRKYEISLCDDSNVDSVDAMENLKSGQDKLIGVHLELF
jgi:hypothetical protein